MTPEDRANKDLKIRSLTSVMGALNERLKSEVRRTIDTARKRGESDAGFWAAASRKIESIYAIMTAEFRVFVMDRFPDVYAEARARVLKAFKDRDARRELESSVDGMVRDSIARFLTAAEDGKRNIDALFRSTQQTLIEDRRISDLVVQGVAEGDAPRSIVRQIQQDLETAIIEKGQTLQINGRNYDPKYYSELVARTRGREAQSLAAVDTVRQYGQDLVKISSHNTPTPECQEYEGKTFSLSGETRGYTVLDRYPPFHPNCRHVIVPVVGEP